MPGHGRSSVTVKEQRRAPSITQPLVVVVILNYNGGDLLKRCVESFSLADYARLRILVVDNASTDGSADEISEAPGILELIRCESNGGYTGGNNVGIRRALEVGADYVLVVNADTVVLRPAFITRMVEYSEANPDVGICGPRVCFQREGHVQNTICQVPRPLLGAVTWIAQRLGWRPVRSGDLEVDAPVLNGVCILVRSAVFREVGVFDHSIFMYREDADLAIRARGQGWRSVYVPIDSILHLQKSEGYDYLGMVNFLLKRNAVLLMMNCGRPASALVMAVMVLGVSSMRAVAATARRRRVRDHWRFVRVLARSLGAVFRRDHDCASFGPPAASWAGVTSQTDA